MVGISIPLENFSTVVSCNDQINDKKSLTKYSNFVSAPPTFDETVSKDFTDFNDQQQPKFGWNVQPRIPSAPSAPSF